MNRKIEILNASVFSLLIVLVLSLCINLLKYYQEYQNQKVQISELNATIEDLTQGINNLESVVKLHKDNSFNLKIKEIIVKDIKNIDYVSNEEKSIIYNTILDVSEKYTTDPLLIYAVIWTESRFKSYIEHDEVFIKSLNKKVKAVGLGGIVYEFWSKDLKKAQIIETRQDLFNPAKNINAIGFILDKYSKMPLLKESKNVNESTLMRYYGSQYASYEKKVYNKIAKMIMNVEYSKF